MKSTESETGMPRNILIALSAGVLPVYAFSFPLPQETITRRNKKVQLIFMSLVLYKIQVTGSDLKLSSTYGFIFLMKGNLFSAGSKSQTSPLIVVFAQHLFLILNRYLYNKTKNNNY